MTILAQLISWLNTIGNGLFGLFEKPMTVLPAWLSLTLISAVLGVLMLLLFKYTSNQTAIGKVRDTIKGHLLAMKLFKDNPKVILKTPWLVIGQAFLLLFYAIRPMLIMALPFSLIVIGQLGLWYQSHPLPTGEQTEITMQLANNNEGPMPPVSLEPSDAAKVIIGPIHVPSKQQIYWKIQATSPGSHYLTFQVGDQQVKKNLAIGNGLMSVSINRPGLNIEDLILHPAEKPFEKSSIVQSIIIDYPARFPSFLGFGLWFWIILGIAIIAGFIFKPFFNVKI